MARALFASWVARVGCFQLSSSPIPFFGVCSVLLLGPSAQSSLRQSNQSNGSSPGPAVLYCVSTLQFTYTKESGFSLSFQAIKIYGSTHSQFTYTLGGLHLKTKSGYKYIELTGILGNPYSLG